MRNVLVLTITFLVLGGAGCSLFSRSSDTGDNQSTNSVTMLNKVDNETYKDFSLETPVKFVETSEAQEVVFFMGQGWMGGMGSYPVLENPGELKRLNDFAVYVNEDQAQALIEDAGGLPSCFSGKPVIKVAAKVRLDLKTERNYSIPDAPEQSYYEATIDELYNVLLQAEPCRDN